MESDHVTYVGLVLEYRMETHSINSRNPRVRCKVNRFKHSSRAADLSDWAKAPDSQRTFLIIDQ